MKPNTRQDEEQTTLKPIWYEQNIILAHGYDTLQIPMDADNLIHQINDHWNHSIIRTPFPKIGHECRKRVIMQFQSTGNQA